MSKYKHFAEEIKAAEPSISNAELGAKVKARIAKEVPTLTPYDVHGLPDPMNTAVDITDDIRTMGASIIGVGKKDIMIQYVRKASPKVSRVVVDIETGTTYNRLMRAEPIGVMVAFIHQGELLIGWSKYNFKKDDDGKQIERLVFTKKDAIETAVLRALTDNVYEASTPYKIAECLPAFFDRAEKYFGQLTNNAVESTTIGYA